MELVFVGHDWVEVHHDVYVEDGEGKRLVKARLPEGVEGVARFHELVAPFVEEPSEVVIATETDRGLFIGALVAAGYTVLAVNPMSTARYRERHSTSGAKSDPGDARALAELARTDRHNHRPVAGDSDLAEAVKVLARAHQGLVWSRQRQLNQLRSTLREFYPAALSAFDELGSPDALAVLALAPTPALGRRLSQSKIASALRRAGRQRRVEAVEIQQALRSPQLGPAPPPGRRLLPVGFHRPEHQPRSPSLYDQHRASGDTHHRALRALANRLVGLLHGCLRHGTPYDETIAWAHRHKQAA